MPFNEAMYIGEDRSIPIVRDLHVIFFPEFPTFEHVVSDVKRAQDTRAIHFQRIYWCPAFAGEEKGSIRCEIPLPRDITARSASVIFIGALGDLETGGSGFKGFEDGIFTGEGEAKVHLPTGLVSDEDDYISGSGGKNGAGYHGNEQGDQNKGG